MYTWYLRQVSFDVLRNAMERIVVRERYLKGEGWTISRGLTIVVHLVSS
jgi:hypothetical protein